MIKLVNSPCVIKCKVHANYDSVQSVSVLVRARGVGGVAARAARTPDERREVRLGERL